MRIIIVIPIYNEEEQLPDTINGLLKVKEREKEITIIGVDDYSTDNSVALVNKYGIKTISNKFDKGRDGAIKTGLEYCKNNYSFDWVVTFDADGQHTSDFLKELNFDFQKLFKGNRFSGTSAQYYTPPDRVKLAQVISKEIDSKFKLKIRDPNCGLLAIPESLLEWVLDNCTFQKHCSLEICLKVLISFPNKIELIECPIPAIYHRTRKNFKKYAKNRAEERFKTRYNSLYKTISSIS